MPNSCPHPRSYVDTNEKIARFIFEEKHLKTKSQETFKPPNSLKFSTYRVTKLQECQIWNIGDEFVSKPRRLPIIGRVDLDASNYQAEKLEFEPNGLPHTRHTDVVGWNTSKPDDLERRANLAMAGVWLTK